MSLEPVPCSGLSTLAPGEETRLWIITWANQPAADISKTTMLLFTYVLYVSHAWVDQLYYGGV